MTGQRRGAITAATWLIGLGVVLLVREVMDWSWGQAWPLFVILVGVATFISTLWSGGPGSPDCGRSRGPWPGRSGASCCS